MGEMSRNFLLKCRGAGARRVVGLAAAVAFLAGCSTYDSITQRVAQSITPYRITVVQGNFVSQEAAAKMRAGMTRAEVKTALGTPLLTDMFHADRWDYLFYFKRGSTAVVQQRDFVVHFNGDQVVSWEGGEDLPSELELLADIDGDKRGKKAKAAGMAAAASATAAASAAAAATAPQAASAAAAESGTNANANAVIGTDANAQAAQAANRAVNATTAAPAVRSGAAPAPGAPAVAVPQFQFHRAPPPAKQDQTEPVGPTSPQSRDSSAPRNQPSASAQSATASGG